MKPALLFVSLMCLGVSSIAQSNCQLQIEGNVIDEHDGSALGFANVYIEGLNVGTVSDEFGNYLLSGICPGEWIVVCSHVGCEPVRDTLTVTKNTRHNFYPEHHSELLEGISILETQDRSEAIEHMSAVPDLPQNSGKSLGNMLTQITGVDALSTGSGISKPIIQGLHSNRVLVLNNGVRQEGQQWGNEHAPEVDPFIAGEVLVLKGASSVKYGPDAIGGVVLVNPSPLPDSFGIGGKVQVTGQSNGLGGSINSMLEGRHQKLKHFRWRAQGSTKKLGDQHAPDYNLKNTGLEEYNFSVAASLSDEHDGIEVFYSQFNTNLGILAASHIGNLTDLQRAFEASEPLDESEFSHVIGRPFQRVEHELLKVSSQKKTGEYSNLNLIYGRQYNHRQEFDRHRGLDASVPGLQFEIVTNSIDIGWETHRFEKHEIQLGGAGLLQKNTYQGRFFIPNFRKWTGGVYVIDKWFITDNWTVEAGARMDLVLQRVYQWSNNEIQETTHAFQQPSVTAGSIYQMGQHWDWKLHVASAWRPPNVNELYSNGLHHGAATVELGDTNLVKELSYNGRTSINYVNERLEFSGEVYINFMPNFIYLAPVFPATLTIRGAFPTYAHHQTDALLYGLDNRIQFSVSKWFAIESATSILRARDLQNNEWLVLMPADNSRLNLKFNHQKGSISTFLEPSLIWVNQQWRVPSNSDYVNPPSSYMLINLSSGISKTTKDGELSAHLEIENILNQRYRSYLNRYRYFADEMGRNFVLRLMYSF